MASSNPIKFAADRQNQTILTTLQYFIAQLPTFFQGDVKDIIIQVFDPGGTVSPVTPVDMLGYVMRVSIGTQPTGNTPSTILAQNINVTWNPAPGNASVTGNQAGYFSGTLDLTQSALTSALGNQPQITAYLDIDVRLGGVTQTILQTPITIAAVVDTGVNTSSPNPPSNYATIAENKAAFLSKAGTIADQKIWLSPDGTKAVLQFLDNSGRMQFEPITPPPAPQ